MNKLRLPKQLEKHATLPLLFDERSGKFVVGSSEDYVSPHRLLNELPYKTDVLALADLPKLYFGVVDGSYFVTGPQINTLLQAQSRMPKTMAQFAVRGAMQVMSDVHAELHISSIEEDTAAFTAQQDIRQGTVKFTNAATNATFSTGRNGVIVRSAEMKTTGFCQYEANAANGVELVSFLAGIGHIAYKAANY